MIKFALLYLYLYIYIYLFYILLMDKQPNTKDSKQDLKTLITKVDNRGEDKRRNRN